MHQSLHNAEYEDSIIHSKFISRTLTGSLSPALYHLLSDGLLPTVTTFFGQVTNSIWRVVEASVKKGNNVDDSLNNKREIRLHAWSNL